MINERDLQIYKYLVKEYNGDRISGSLTSRLVYMENENELKNKSLLLYSICMFEARRYSEFISYEDISNKKIIPSNDFMNLVMKKKIILL